MKQLKFYLYAFIAKVIWEISKHVSLEYQQGKSGVIF